MTQLLFQAQCGMCAWRGEVQVNQQDALQDVNDHTYENSDHHAVVIDVTDA